jgi:hypothetical protein
MAFSAVPYESVFIRCHHPFESFREFEQQKIIDSQELKDLEQINTWWSSPSLHHFILINKKLSDEYSMLIVVLSCYMLKIQHAFIITQTTACAKQVCAEFCGENGNPSSAVLVKRGLYDKDVAFKNCCLPWFQRVIMKRNRLPTFSFEGEYELLIVSECQIHRLHKLCNSDIDLIIAVVTQPKNKKSFVNHICTQFANNAILFVEWKEQ